MSNSNLRPIALVVLAVVAASLGCGTPTDGFYQGEATQPPKQDLCYATPYLSVTSQITHQETNQFGTRICEYTLKITSGYPGEVYFYVFQHRADGYQATEDFKWMGNIRLGPGESDEWEGYVNLYSDPDASGPVMSVPERFAGVFG